MGWLDWLSMSGPVTGVPYVEKYAYGSDKAPDAPEEYKGLVRDTKMTDDEWDAKKRQKDNPQWWGGWMGFSPGPESDLVSKSVQAGDNLTKAGGQMVGDAQESLTLAKNHYQRLLAGDSDTTMRALQPQVRGILHQYDAAKRATGEFGPRGGGRNEAMQDINFKEAGDVGTLIGGQATEAANKLRDIGAQFGYVGLGETGQGEASYMDALRAIMQQQSLYLQSTGMSIQEQQAKQQLQGNQWGQIGYAAAQAVQQWQSSG